MFNDNKFADKIANCSYKHYETCISRRGKPRNDKEWTLFASIVMKITTGTSSPDIDDDDDMELKVVAMGTGTKCIGFKKMSEKGDILNDSHAEIIARRSFLRFLYKEISLVYSDEGSKVFCLQSPEEGNLCVLRPEISFHFFMSHTPCGDASIFPKMTHEMSDCIGDECSPKRKANEAENNKRKRIEVSSQQNVPEELVSKQPKIHFENQKTFNTKPQQKEQILNKEKMATSESIEKKQTAAENPVFKEDIFRTGAKCVPSGVQDDHAPGIGYHCVGVLRTKPGRGYRTLSLSCSDKIARWNILGCQGALMNHFLEKPIFFDSFILGKCPFNKEAFYRAIVGRLKMKNSILAEKNYEIPEPKIMQSSLQFQNGKYLQNSGIKFCQKENSDPCNTSIVWYVSGNQSVEEVSVNGRKQGSTQKNSNNPSSRLSICSKELFVEFKRILECSAKLNKQPKSLKQFSKPDSLCTYHAYKMASNNYQNVWSDLREGILKTWIQKPQKFLQFTVE